MAPEVHRKNAFGIFLVKLGKNKGILHLYKGP